MCLFIMDTCNATTQPDICHNYGNMSGKHRRLFYLNNLATKMNLFLGAGNSQTISQVYHEWSFRTSGIKKKLE